MKILRRNYEHRNLILFLIFSLVYLQAIYSLSKGISLLSLEETKAFFTNHSFILALTAVTLYMIIKIKKHSDKMLLLCLSVITAKNFIMLAASFNKLILGLNFVYLIFAFYFFVTWELEIAKASYNPNFSENDLEKESRFQLKGKIENADGAEAFEVHITNIDENSCFALINKENTALFIAQLKNNEVYLLTAEYEGVEFTHKAQLTSTYDRGIGLDFIKENKTDMRLNWSDLYKVCLERGFFS